MGKTLLNIFLVLICLGVLLSLLPYAWILFIPAIFLYRRKFREEPLRKKKYTAALGDVIPVVPVRIRLRAGISP